MEYIRDEMAGKRVFVVARNNAAETNRIKLFTAYPDVKAEELIISDTSPDLEKRIFTIIWMMIRAPFLFCRIMPKQMSRL